MHLITDYFFKILIETGTALSILVINVNFSITVLWYTYHHMWKSPENDAMPYARESPDREKMNHKYKDEIPQKYITTADPSSSRMIMVCDLYCCL